jgi:hypothetical protein
MRRKRRVGNAGQSPAKSEGLVDRKLVANAAVLSNVQSVAGDACLTGWGSSVANFSEPVARSEHHHGISKKAGRKG